MTPRRIITVLPSLAGGCALFLALSAPAFAQRYPDGQGGGYGGGGGYQRPAATRPSRDGGMRPGRRHGGGMGGSLGGAAIGLGAGIIGGILLDQAMRRPAYEPDEPLPPPQRRLRRPVVVDDDEDEPVVRRPRRPPPVREAAPPRRPAPVREAAPPRQPPARTAQPAPTRQPGVIVPAAAETRLVNEEILFELAPGAQAEAVLRRHRATLIASRRFELAGVTIIRARLNDGRSARTVLGQMAGDARVASAQPNYLYALQQQAAAADAPAPEVAAEPPTDAAVQPAEPETAAQEPAPLLPAPLAPAPEVPAESPTVTAVQPAEPEPAAQPAQPLGSAPERPATAALTAPAQPSPAQAAPLKQPQYVVDKLGLAGAHQIARGERIKVAVIDSGADHEHAELRAVVAGRLDTLGGEFAPHAHGTAMAAAILAQSQLQGVAPAARLLAARAFSGGAGPASASGTTFHILTALDWSAEQGARVFNLSFAGPQDRLLSRSLAGARAKGIVSVAAAGNGGAKAAPLYPGADANVIAVTATDADDKPFAQANRGAYVAVAAPGVDVLAAEPAGRYAFSSGTSIAAAHVSGLVALLLEKRPDLDLDGVRKLLMDSAVDLGARGRDPVFGAGRVDAPAALARALPVSAARP